MSEPEVIHSADIPEDVAAAEAQEALLARIEDVRSTRPVGGNTPREKKQRAGAAKREERITVQGRSLEPIAQQTPRKAGNPALVKGKSLNPGGVSKIDRAIRDYARAHCFEAIDFLTMVMRDPLCRTSDRADAAKALVDYARLSKTVEGEGGGDGGTTVTINVLKIGDQVIKF